MKTKLFLLLFLPVILIPDLLFAQFTQQGPKLVGTGAVGIANQGLTVAISADGNTAIVGGAFDNSTVGAVWIFTRTAGVWTQQGPKLVGSDAAGNALQGYSVSISADGNTAIVGGLYDNNFAGAGWIFVRSAGVWTQQGPKLVGTGAVGNSEQGWSVAISADGNTALMSGPVDNSNKGATWVFTRTAGVWTQQGTKLVGTGAIGAFVFQGSSLGVSTDGNTAVIGGSSDNGNIGAIWIFTRSAGVWTQQGSKLVGTGATGNADQGYSSSISADGNTIIEGAYGDNGNTGALWVFTRSAGVWTQQGTKLVGTGSVGAAFQGFSCSISSDGNTIVEGAYKDNTNAGAIWAFTRTGGVWTQLGSKLVGTGAIGTSVYQGHSVSISLEGTVIEGGFYDNNQLGAAWIFYDPTVGITPVSTDIPKSFSLSQNYPNPFNPTSKIRFAVQTTSLTALMVYDILGREVATLVNQQLQPGTYEVSFDGTNLPSGIYFYRLVAGNFVETKKMSLVK